MKYGNIFILFQIKYFHVLQCEFDEWHPRSDGWAKILTSLCQPLLNPTCFSRHDSFWIVPASRYRCREIAYIYGVNFEIIKTYLYISVVSIKFVCRVAPLFKASLLQWKGDQRRGVASLEWDKLVAFSEIWPNKMVAFDGNGLAL